MAARRSKFNRFLLNRHCRRALHASVVLALAPSFTARAAQNAGPTLSANPPAIPTTIRNAPFSAEVFTQYDRVLANGNHIHRETRGKVFRDPQGRVRTESQIPVLAGSFDSNQHIAIQDPVLRMVIHLDPRTRTATEHHLGEPVQAAPGNNPAGKAGNFVLLSPGTGASSGTNSAVPLQHGYSSGPPTIESLGIKLIEGVPAEGTRTTRVFASSNGEPIVAVTDIWFSRDLQMVVLSVADDGEGGRTTVRVTNLARVAPNEQLFQVPADYTIKDDNPIAVVIKH